MAEATTVDTLDIQISASASKAMRSLTNLAKRMERVTAAAAKMREALTEQKETTEETAEAEEKTDESTESISDSLKKLTASTHKATGALKKLVKAFGRIMLYRAIRNIIKNIGAAIKEGLTNLKAYSEAVGTEFSPAVDTLRQHVTMLKNAFATALRPVIEALIPVIIQLVDWFSKLADFAAQVLSVLTGKVDKNNRYTKAVLGDLEQSNKEAKELRRTLLGFDEINRLDAPDKSKKESNNATTMFTQADVSPEAASVAEKLATAWEKIKEIIAKIDWDRVRDFIIGILALKAGLGLVEKLKKVVDFLKEIGVIIGKAGIWGVILAIIAVCALFGDKISAWLSTFSTKIRNFLLKLQLKVKSFYTYSVIKMAGEALSFILDIIGDIADGIYKLFHGDFQGALDAGWKLIKDVLKLIVSVIAGTINGILGIVSDAINGVASAWTWLHNNVFAPAGNWIHTAIENVGIWFHNFGVNIKIAVVTFWKFFLERLNDGLGAAQDTINELIEVINWALGTNLKPLDFKFDTTALDKKLIELRDTKLPPITETIEVYGQWKDPAKLKLQIDTTAAYRAIDSIGEKVNRLGNAISSVAGGLAATSGSNAALKWNMTKYASGGFPSVGSVFIAGESGAEYVTTINGQTGVYNTDQMAAAMYKAVSAALATMPRSGGDIYLDGEVIYRNVVNRNNNQVRSTGRAALLT